MTQEAKRSLTIDMIFAIPVVVLAILLLDKPPSKSELTFLGMLTFSMVLLAFHLAVKWTDWVEIERIEQALDELNR